MCTVFHGSSYAVISLQRQMVGCDCSTSDRPTLAMLQTMAFPVVSLVRFWANHHLLDLAQRPVWRVVKGRSRQYVQKIVAGMDHLSWQLVN